MSNLENTRIEENARELFICAIQDDYKLDSLVVENYFDDLTIWKMKEFGSDSLEEYDGVFDRLLAHDFEFTLRDPIECAKFYVDTLGKYPKKRKTS